MNSIALSLLAEQLEGIAQEMGSALARSAFSPNIRVRRDFSCALFTEGGELLAQAAHIPVHLGSMPAHVRRLVQSHTLSAGEFYLGNDPYDGGTHLPDLTLLRPVFEGELCLGIAAVRAHHADVGGPVPGSMSSQRDIHGEGLRLPLVRLASDNQWDSEITAILWANMRNPSEREGDLLAQQSACLVAEKGLRRLFHGWASHDLARWRQGREELMESSRQRVLQGLSRVLPQKAQGRCRDLLEVPPDLLAPIEVALTFQGDRLSADFSGTSPAVNASFNSPLPVAQAALAYVVNCILPEPVPINEGLLRCVEVVAPPGCLIHARYPAAVAAGTVETSPRGVDVLLGALAEIAPNLIPAASAGSMNNLSFGFPNGKVHYETSGGGYGGHPQAAGRSALQIHMTNTRSTPNEVLETEFPLRISKHAIRTDSGGEGLHPGGDGIDKQIEFLSEVTVSLMATRRTTAPPGVAGGEAGQPGRQSVKPLGQEWKVQPGSFSLELPAGSALRLQTPGGGGWGAREVKPSD